MRLENHHIEALENLLFECIYDGGISREFVATEAATQIRNIAHLHVFCPQHTFHNAYTMMGHAMIADLEAKSSQREFDDEQAKEHVKAATILYAIGMVREGKFRKIQQFPEHVEVDPTLKGVENWSHVTVDTLALYCEYKGRFDLAARAMRKIKDERAKSYDVIIKIQKSLDMTTAN